MITKNNLKDRNFNKRNTKIKYYYMFFIFIIILIAFIIGMSGCNSQIITTIEQPFVLATDKCFCQKKISDKIIIQNDSGYKFMFKDREGYKSLTDEIGFDTTSIGFLLTANWYQSIIIK